MISDMNEVGFKVARTQLLWNHSSCNWFTMIFKGTVVCAGARKFQ